MSMEVLKVILYVSVVDLLIKLIVQFEPTKITPKPLSDAMKETLRQIKKMEKFTRFY